MPVIVCPRDPLSRDLDVSISISRPITEIATDMSLLMFCTPSVDFPAGNGRVRFYSSMKALEADVAPSSPAWFAGSAFFSRDDRPARMGVGRIVEEPTHAELIGGVVSPQVLAGISNGAFMLSVNDAPAQVVGPMVFGANPTLTSIVEALNTSVSALGVEASIYHNNHIMLQTNGTGDGMTISYATPATSVPAKPATHGTLKSGDSLDLTAIKALTNGGFDLTVAASTAKITGLNFSTATTLADVASILDAKVASCTVTATETGLLFTTVGEGLVASITYAAPPTATGSPVDASAILKLTQATGAVAVGGADATPEVELTDISNFVALSQDTAEAVVIGYTPGDLASEVALIDTAARCAGNAPYCFVTDAKYRDTEDYQAFASWCEGNSKWGSLCTNAPSAYNTADTTNIGYFCMTNNFTHTSVFYHNNPQYYPEVSYAAIALAVNYALADSTLTLKFKQLPGIPTVPMTETELNNLETRRINTYVAIGNTASTVRPGVQSSPDWFTDSRVNLDNYKEELQVNIWNVFLRNKKVPYTTSGQDLLISAAAAINARYVNNGTFAPRDAASLDNETGYVTYPATDITPTSIYTATASERAARIAPPIFITAYEAGAMHKVSINVNVYN